MVNEDVDIRTNTVGSVLQALAEQYKARIEKYVVDSSTGELRDGILISVNGHDIRGLDKTDTRLKQGDRVLILPPIAGG